MEVGILFILTLTLKFSLSTEKYTAKHFNTQLPLIEGLSPKGIRVSIDHIDVADFFSFHGKINSPIGHNENGVIFKNITYPTFGRWAFEDNSVQLKVGDVVNYWIFLQINGMAYRINNLSSIIRELIPNTRPLKKDYYVLSSTSSSQTPTTITYIPNCNSHTRTEILPENCNCGQLRSTKAIRPCPLSSYLLNLPEQTKRISSLQVQVESLRELVQELTKDVNIGTQLLLTGQQPPDSNPLEAMRQLITEKLELIDLEQKIKQAHQTEHGIIFEVTSPIDKLRIISRAKKRLDYSKYQIINSKKPKSKIKQVRITLP